MHRARTLSPVFLAAALAAAPAAAQSIGGVIRDDVTGGPIPAATVLLLDSAGITAASTSSDEAGRFDLAIPGAGAFTLRVEHIGYGPAGTSVFRVEGDPRLEVELRLTTRAVVLPPVVVRTAARSMRLAESGFYDRQHMAMGRFITGEELALRGPLTLTDYLRSEPSVHHLWVSDENRWAVIFRGAARMSLTSTTPCFPLVVLDATRINGEVDLDALVHPTDLAGVELYPSGNGAPPQYVGLGAPCGIILLWTRTG